VTTTCFFVALLYGQTVSISRKEDRFRLPEKDREKGWAVNTCKGFLSFPGTGPVFIPETVLMSLA
jgi:hypothetical protein